jgi:N-glycosylase/DNA lyase
MILTISDDFDPDKIADSGQCFRWEKLEPFTYRIISGAECLYLTALGDDCYELECSDEFFAAFWHSYLDLDEDYARIRARIDPASDPFLFQASEQEKGVRILRQDPWEMLVTFIISQNRNIPAIRRSVELLAEQCGEQRIDSRGKPYCAFPTPSSVAALSEEALAQCRLGYRCRYVHAAAVSVLRGEIDLKHLRDADEEATIGALSSLLGVGVKVANCVSLFGLHHLNAFPRDVWMNRVLAQEYPNGYPFDAYSPYNGIYQQYMFAWVRHRGEQA